MWQIKIRIGRKWEEWRRWGVGCGDLGENAWSFIFHYELSVNSTYPIIVCASQIHRAWNASELAVWYVLRDMFFICVTYKPTNGGSGLQGVRAGGRTYTACMDRKRTPLRAF